MNKLDNVADKYDNTKLKSFLSLSCMICIGVLIYWGISFGLGDLLSFAGDMVYPILMLVHMFVLKDEQRHKLFQWKHS
jgi:hypothetical protein